jgi:hypothetical protein
VHEFNQSVNHVPYLFTQYWVIFFKRVLSNVLHSFLGHMIATDVCDVYVKFYRNSSRGCGVTVKKHKLDGLFNRFYRQSRKKCVRTLNLLFVLFLP